MSSDLHDYPDKYLQSEFDRLIRLRDEAQLGITAIRAEQARRRDAEIERLRAEIAAKKGGA